MSGQGTSVGRRRGVTTLAGIRPELRLESGQQDESPCSGSPEGKENKGNSDQQEIGITNRTERGSSGGLQKGEGAARQDGRDFSDENMMISREMRWGSTWHAAMKAMTRAGTCTGVKEGGWNVRRGEKRRKELRGCSLTDALAALECEGHQSQGRVRQAHPGFIEC